MPKQIHTQNVPVETTTNIAVKLSSITSFSIKKDFKQDSSSLKNNPMNEKNEHKILLEKVKGLLEEF